MDYTVNGQHFSYHSNGEKSWGKNMVLLDHAVDLTAGKPWHDNGFTIEPLFDAERYHSFIKTTTAILLECWKAAGLQVDTGYSLQDYHKLINTREDHLRAVDKTKLLSVDNFPIPIQWLEERISAICQTPLITCNPFDQQRIFHFRVVRPGNTDNNPLHRDVWLADYDDCINLYIPIAGSNERTSLMIIPGSHRWPESHVERTRAGADINNMKFNVPAVTDIRGDFHVVRPSPQANQVLVFSPYLIHGGSVNSSPDQTRISIEIRLWKSGLAKS